MCVLRVYFIWGGEGGGARSRSKQKYLRARRESFFREGQGDESTREMLPTSDWFIYRRTSVIIYFNLKNT